MTPVSGRAFGRAADAGIYTRAQLLDFWYNNFFSVASRKALERFFQEIVVPNTADHGPEKHYFFCSVHGHLCGQHDFPQLLQK